MTAPSIALAAALLAALPLPASAHPALGVAAVRRHVTATAQVHVLATNRSVYRVTVFSSVVHAESTTPFSWAEVRVAKCVKGTCATPVAYWTPLPATAYDAGDLKKVTVRFAGFGKPIVVTLVGAGPSGDVDSTPAVAGGVVDLSSPWTVTATVSFLGKTCTAPSEAARHTTLYPTGFSEPEGMVAIPAAAPPGQPAAAKSCRPGPA